MSRRRTPCRIAAAGWAALLVMPALAADTIDPAVVERAIESSWTKAAPEWRARLEQDETQKVCSDTRNHPTAETAAGIRQREKATIVYPPDGKLMGDWKNGENLALSGYGGRFTDKDASRPNGGNCYACHQLAPSEIDYGTLGPSLTGYGRAHKFDEGTTRLVYEKIYNSQSLQACSLMPRFGASKFLSIEQIKDLVAFVVSPDSPVNK